MRLPEDLSLALSEELAKVPRKGLSEAAAELSQRYRSSERDKHKVFMSDEMHRLAYLAVRLPATFAVVARVLEEIKKRLPDFSPKSVCDLGAGPGTATWAAIKEFPDIAQAVLYEKDSQWLGIGRRLMEKADEQCLREAVWRQGDISDEFAFEPQDLVVLSYVVGELPVVELCEYISKIWKLTGHVLAIIEPGTLHGFERIRLVRERLIQEGAFMVAPCPHCNTCPMAHGDWCHFSQRLERSAWHMSIKDVALGYEDEKYSYVVVSKTPVALPEARVLRHPQHHSGHIDLTLCAREGLEHQVVSRRQGAVYKQARKLEWGDGWEKARMKDEE